MAKMATLNGKAYGEFLTAHYGRDINPFHNPTASLILDYLWIKRVGLGSLAMNGMGLAILLGCLGAIVVGVRRRQTGWLVLGTWGALCAAQTLTGVLQFSAYQRAGWELLVVAACLMGASAAFVYTRWSSHRALRAATVTAIAAVCLTALLHPPSHRYMLSRCEDDIVRVARQLERSHTQPDSWRHPHVRFEKASTSPLVEALEQEPDLTIVSRKFTGMGGRVAEPIAAVLRRNSPIKSKQVKANRSEELLSDVPGVYVCLLDTPGRAEHAGIHAPTKTFAAVSPRLARGMAKWHGKLLSLNADIEARIEEFQAQGATLQTFQEGRRLRIIVVTPATTEPPPPVQEDPAS
jgi:hypothetical protein